MAAGRTDTLIRIWIPGTPQGKGRARARIAGKGAKQFIQHYTPGKTRSYEEAIKVLAAAQMSGRPPLVGAVHMALVIVMPVPKSWPNWKRELVDKDAIAPTTKPDSDNVEKAVKDALNGVVWKDDAQVVYTSKLKIYQRTEHYTEPGVLAIVTRSKKKPAQVNSDTLEEDPDSWLANMKSSN